jgi:2-keto-3-deoxy-L-rhamnonate aldolase RhmA
MHGADYPLRAYRDLRAETKYVSSGGGVALVQADASVGPSIRAERTGESRSKVFENKVKKLLAQGKAAWGAGLVDSSLLMAKFTVNTGIDFLWMDTEHCAYGLESIAMVPVICRQQGCVPMVRVANLDAGLIKKALDIGASAVMIPQVSNATEARLAVRYAKYPPEGSRGVSPIWTMFMDISYEEYLPTANDETCIVVQVETPEGIENLEAIAEVEGVDVVFAGPSDLAASLGYIGQNTHPVVQKFLDDFPRRVAKTGKSSGISLAGFEACRQAYEQGYRFICIGHILWQGHLGLTADLKRLRENAARTLGEDTKKAST